MLQLIKDNLFFNVNKKRKKILIKLPLFTEKVRNLTKILNFTKMLLLNFLQNSGYWLKMNTHVKFFKF